MQVPTLKSLRRSLQGTALSQEERELLPLAACDHGAFVGLSNMVTEIVTFKLPPGMSRAEVFARYETTAPKWQANPDLIRKNYLYDPEQGVAGGVYLWRERAQADKWHGAEFRAMIRQMWGTEPHSQFFETPIVVDNVAGILSRD